MRLSRSARSTVRRDVGADRHDLEPDRLALAGEPLEQLGRLERLDDREHVVALRGHPRRGPLPAAEVRQREDHALARGERVGDVLVALDR